ncbi:MAG: PD-(D/E)XK nuclease family protein [Bdellovibrionales bacterium]|nr:PD-(D/E)XK nuclease family protein [Bdellovibrionales bacterium]
MLERHFLGFPPGFLAEAARCLIEQHSEDLRCDLSQLLLVLPTSRVERRLLELLVEEADRRRLFFVPPRRVTVGSLPEQCYQPRGPLAEPLVRRLAFLQAINHIAPQQLAVLGPLIPAAASVLERELLAERLLSLWSDEIAVAGIRFATVRDYHQQNGAFGEAARWEVLEQLHGAYLGELERLGLRDREEERLVACEEARLHTDSPVVLIGCAEFKPLVTRMLTQANLVGDCFIPAPERFAAGFDELGCMVTSFWQSTPVRPRAEQLRIAENPLGQAAAVAQVLEEFADGYTPEELTLGSPDPQVIPFLTNYLGRHGIRVRDARGISMAECSPLKLLSILRLHLLQPTYQTFAELIRHPDLERWLEQELAIAPGSLPTLSDVYQCDHLQSSFTPAAVGESVPAPLRALATKLTDLLKAFSQEQSLEAWAESLLELFRLVYGTLSATDRSRRTTYESCLQVLDVLHELAGLEGVGSSTSAVEALSLVLHALSTRRVPPTALDDEIELLGWLELPLDDAELLIVCGLNEGCIPERCGPDAFLPDSLRRKLGVTDDSQRLARDSYVLALLLGEERKTFLIAGRRNVLGEVLQPSRLLLPAEGRALAEALLRFYEGAADADGSTFFLAKAPTARPFPSIQAPPPQQVERMSVRSFADYLRCPYRFYLRHVLRLESVDDDVHEMDGRVFGILLHDVLRSFGEEDAAKDSTDARELCSLLDTLLDRTFLTRFGRGALPAVALQRELARARLHAFARWQAFDRRQGWRIAYIEHDIDPLHTCLALPNNRQMQVGCRIDRIDIHQSTGEWRIIDYKTGDRAQSPEKAHCPKGDWVDLQLPLYDLFIRRAFSQVTQLALCYLWLPADFEKKPLSIAQASWGFEDLQRATQVAHEVATAVSNGVFWPYHRDHPFDPALDEILRGLPELSS